jgi:phosphate-selective porin OprO/OprP
MRTFLFQLAFGTVMLLSAVAAGLDKPERQVAIDSRIAEVDRSAVNELPRNFESTIEKIVEDALQKQDLLLKQGEEDEDPWRLKFYWDNGVRAKTRNNYLKMKLGGRLMYDFNWQAENNGIERAFGQGYDGTEVRRARLYWSGEFCDTVFWKTQYDFAGGDADLKDFFAGLKLPFNSKLTVGHFKEPFSLEELTSSKYITFLERALPNAFAPGRNAGIMWDANAWDGLLRYAVGVFRDTDDFGETHDDDDGNAVTMRLTASPLYASKGFWVGHLGVNYSHRTEPNNMVRYRQRPEFHQAHRFVNTGHIHSDDQDLLGVEGALVLGPFSVQSEWIHSWTERNLRAYQMPGLDFDGAYVQGSFFLTGEHRKYKRKDAACSRVKPKNNFCLKKGKSGIGAIELVGRYSMIDLNSNDVMGGQMEDMTFGINWYLNPNTRLMFDWVHSDVEDIGDWNGFGVRVQVDF